MGNEQKPKPPQSPEDKMFDNIFEFKMVGKQLNKEASKAKAKEKQLLDKVKKAIEKGDYENAKVLANDAIRARKEAQRDKAMASKVDTIASRLQSAMNTQKLTSSMRDLTEKMVGASNCMDMVKMTQTLDSFEKMFDNIDVHAGMMDQVFDNVNEGTSNEMEVNDLLQQVAEQNGLKLADEMGIDAGANEIRVGAGTENVGGNQVGEGGF